MMTGDLVEDDFNELSDLLFGATERYRTVRATVRHRRIGHLATAANRRFVNYRFPHGGLQGIGIPSDEPPYRVFESLEELSRLWHERPDRWRQETALSDGSGTCYRVADGKGPWWFYQPPDWVDCYPTNDGSFTPDTELSFLLDPSEIYNRLDNCALLIAGHVQLEGREAIEVQAKAISWDYAPGIPFFEGADDYRIWVDPDIGLILRFSSRLGDKEFDVIEVLDIAFDEEFPPRTFALDLPGVRFDKRKR